VFGRSANESRFFFYQTVIVVTWQTPASQKITMLDLKALKVALETLETERRVPREKIIDAIEQALAAAYKKDYGKRGQIVRAHFDVETGKTDFYQVKIVADESSVYVVPEGEEAPLLAEDDERTRFNAEHHIMLEDAQKIKENVAVGDEITFPLESKEDYGRIAAQTAKQVIIQRLREAEHGAILEEFGGREGDIVSGIIQKIERGMVFLDIGRVTAVLPKEEQIPGEFYRRGERLRAYLYSVEESPRGVSLKVSRTHPKFVIALFAQEAPEIASGTVEIKSISREAGSRTKIAVYSADEHVDPVGSCVGQKGIRVTTVMSELGSEKIDIIEWNENTAEFVSAALSPAKALSVTIDEAAHTALVEVADDQLSLAIGKGGQNVRLAAKLTGWKIDIKGVAGETVSSSDGETTSEHEDAPLEESATVEASEE
jgi:N utilization substance protein A